MIISLTGFMGSGKSSVGRHLATLLSRSFIDLDEEIERSEGCTVKELFARRGEDGFRIAETRALEKLLGRAVTDDFILALGGGTPCRKGNAELLDDTFIIYLRAREETLEKRLRDCEERPMLEMRDVHGLLAEREGIYGELADLTVDTDKMSAEETAMKIAGMLAPQAPRFIECCCTSLEEALEAEAGGASRIELCTDLAIGGVTPDITTVREVTGRLKIPVNVLVRPRGGDFIYSRNELDAMLESIAKCKDAGVSGIVIGALLPDGSVDEPAMKELISASRPLNVTFHRAFDESASPLDAFEQVISLGCDRLLTSGAREDAFKGRKMIRELVKRSQGRICVMAGCGVRPHNIAGIQAVSAAREFHSSSHGPAGMTDRNIVSMLVAK